MFWMLVASTYGSINLNHIIVSQDDVYNNCCIIVLYILWNPSYIGAINRIEKIEGGFLKYLCFKFSVLYSTEN